jgi:hypothetical protein
MLTKKIKKLQGLSSTYSGTAMKPTTPEGGNQKRLFTIITFVLHENYYKKNYQKGCIVAHNGYGDYLYPCISVHPQNRYFSYVMRNRDNNKTAGLLYS